MAAPSNFRNMVAITPNDATILTPATALFVVGTGNLVIKTVGGQTVTLASVPAFFTLYVQCTQVLATGTTATGIFALS